MLEQHKEEQDWDALSGLLHNLGGVSGNIGFTEWGKQALALSRTLRAQDALSDVEAAQLRDLVDRLRDVLDGLASFFQSQPSKPSKASSPVMDEGGWASMLAELRPLVEDSSPDALELVQQVQAKWRLSAEEDALLTKVALALDEFEFEQALTHLTSKP